MESQLLQQGNQLRAFAPRETGRGLFHSSGVLAEGSLNQLAALICQVNHPGAPIVRVVFSFHETFVFQPVDGDADGAAGQADFPADCVYRQRSFMQENFQDAEVRQAERKCFDIALCVCA